MGQLDLLDKTIVLATIDDRGRYLPLEEKGLRAKLLALEKEIEKDNIQTIVISVDQSEDNLKVDPSCRLIRATDFDDLIRQLLTTPHPNRKFKDCAEQPGKMPTSPQGLFGREAEIELLNKSWRTGKTNVLTLVAMGGTGKTALVNDWLNKMRENGWSGAEHVYIYSFYSQGASEKNQSSAGQFFAHALNWFGYEGPAIASEHEQGLKLAKLIAKRRALLVLDGLEPLQYPPGEMGGEIRDNGLQSLISNLALNNQGLCLITTRIKLADIGGSPPLVISHNLDNLHLKDGVELLRSLGVSCAEKNREEEELSRAVQYFRGHALALNLLGKYVKIVLDGEITHYFNNIELQNEVPKLGGHAERVMASYEKWLTETNRAELAILHIIGLFDRPAAKCAIDALVRGEEIVGLTDLIRSVSHPKRKNAISHLRDLGLLNPAGESDDGSLDAHPLVREYFGKKLKKNNPEIWRQAHGRLYEYHRDLPARDFPDTILEMDPLFSAIQHGCNAERHQEVFDEIYWRRIQRGDNRYLIHEHGSHGSDLMALANFFEKTWEGPVVSLSKEAQLTVLNFSAFALRAVGRLQEAIYPLQKVTDEPWKTSFPRKATISASNLSQLNISLGNIKSAIDSGNFAKNNSVAYDEKFWNTAALTILADALHRSGDLSEAGKLYKKADEIHKQYYPGTNVLHAQQEFRYSDFLLSSGCSFHAQERVQRLLELKEFSERSILDNALAHLALGKAEMALGKAEKISPIPILELSVEKLRSAAHREFLPYGLIALASAYRLDLNISDAHQCLIEASGLARHANMRLHITDCHLEAALLALTNGDSKGCIHLQEEDENQPSAAVEHIKTASNLIDKTGYGKRQPDLALIRARLAIAKGEPAEAGRQLGIVSGYVDDGWKIHEAEVNELQDALSKK